MSAVSLSLPPALARKPFTACMLDNVNGRAKISPEHTPIQGWVRQSHLQMISTRSHCKGLQLFRKKVPCDTLTNRKDFTFPTHGSLSQPLR